MSISIHRHVAAAGLAAFALLAGGLVAPATAATSTATIKGVVTLDGAPVSFARVQLYRDNATDPDFRDWARVKTANSDSSGAYTMKVSLPKLSSDSQGYRVVVTDRPGNVLKTVRLVKPKKGKSVTRNVTTSRAAIITGSVKRADGGDPSVLKVDVVTDDEVNDDTVQAFLPATSTTVNADGTFSLGGLEGRTYERITVSGDPYDLQCYDVAASKLADCAANFPDSQRLTVTAGEKRALAGVTATKLFPAETTLTGTVTDTSGNPLKGMRVGIEGVVATTRSSGRFTIRAKLPAGTYDASVFDPKVVWAAKYEGEEPGRTFVVTPGQPVSNINTRLKSFPLVKVATEGGKGSAKVAFRITRKATGSLTGGTVTLTGNGVSRTVKITKGKGSVTLTGLPKGRLSLRAVYSGTGSTAGTTKTVTVTVK